MSAAAPRGPILPHRPASSGSLSADIASLRQAGHPMLALPVDLGGTGLDLARAAAAQRSLAARAPLAALALTSHLAWTGAAATVRSSNDPVAEWILGQAARGRLFADQDGPLAPPGWDWLAIRTAGGRPVAGGAAETSSAFVAPGTSAVPGVLSGGAGLSGGPGLSGEVGLSSGGRAGGRVGASGVSGGAVVAHAFVAATDLSLRAVRVRPPGPPGAVAADDPLLAAMYAWALPLTAMTWYAIAQQEFSVAITRAQTRGPAAAGQGRTGHPLDQWPVAEAALRLDALRDRLDRVIADAQQRARAGALTSLDPGGQWLIRLFTVRHVAVGEGRRVMDLAAQIAGDTATAPLPAR